MTDPFLRPDVRQFLGHLGTLPGPRMHEMEPPAARLPYRPGNDVAERPVPFREAVHAAISGAGA